MAISTGQLIVGTTPVQIDGTSTSNFRLHIHNMDNTDALFVGNGDVSVTNGLALPKLDSLELVCYPGESVFVVSTKSGHQMSWMKQL